MIHRLGSLARPQAAIPWPLLSGVGLMLVAEVGLGFASNDPRLMVLYISGLLGLGLAAVVLLRPEQSAPLLLFILFTRVSDAWSLPRPIPTINQLLVIVFLTAMLLFRIIRRREGLIFDRLLGWMLAFGVAIALSAISAVAPSATFAELAAYLREVLILFVLLNLITTLKGLRLAIWTLCLSWHLLIGRSFGIHPDRWDFGGLMHGTTGQLAGGQFGSRLSGPVGDPNDFARLLVIVVPLLLYRVWDEARTTVRVAALGALGLISFVILLTFSRGGILSLLVVLATPIAMGRIKLNYLLAVGLALVVIGFAAPSVFWDRMFASVEYATGGTSSATLNDASLRERSSLVWVGVRLVEEYPIFGVGKGSSNYFSQYRHYAWQVDPALPGRPLEAHNTPVQIAAETGLVGFVTFIGSITVAVVGIFNARRRFDHVGSDHGVLMSESIMVAMFGYLVASLFLSDSYPRYLWLLFGLVMITRQISLRAVHADGRAAAVRA